MNFFRKAKAIARRLLAIARPVFFDATYIVMGRLLTLNPRFFKKKRVILIGPARTVTEELKEIDLSDFDIVVRMNRAIDTPLLMNGEVWRIDVLFHNLKENCERGAGEITAEKIRRSGTKAIVFPGGGASQVGKILDFKWKLLSRRVSAKVLMVDNDLYARIRKSIDEFSPTTGLVALAFLLECDYETLHIVGFTFFQTKYMDSYNDDLKSDNQGYLWAQQRNIHCPVSEATYVKSLLIAQRSKGKDIVLGEHVRQALDNV